MKSKRVVLAYSGGLDTSAVIPWLKESGYEVIATAVDVGQPGDLAGSVERASTLGAVEARLIDAKATFVEEFVLPALKMNALYQGRYPLVSSLSRPLIARELVAVAREAGAVAVAHGCTGKGNDQVRFEVSFGALAPDVEVLAPVRDWGMSRAETIAYVEERDLPIKTTRESPYSIDENLWGRSIECGVLEDPWVSAPEDIFELSSAFHEVPAAPRDVEIGFERGVPVAVDGEHLEPIHAVNALGKLAGAHGFGRIDMVEDRLVGIKSREIYEAPAALSLITAHKDLEGITLERSYAREKRRMDSLWADLVYEGLWFSPLRAGAEAFADVCAPAVTGEVRLRFAAGSCTPVGRRSPDSLYDPKLSTYEADDTFDQGDAAGFVRLWGLPTTQWAKAHPDD